MADNTDRDLDILKRKLQEQHMKSFRSRAKSNDSTSSEDLSELSMLANDGALHNMMKRQEKKRSVGRGLEDLIMNLADKLPNDAASDMTLGQYLMNKAGINEKQVMLDAKTVEPTDNYEAQTKKQAPFVGDRLKDKPETIKVHNFPEGVEKVNPFNAPIFTGKTSKQSEFIFDKSKSYSNTSMKLTDDSNFAPLDLNQYKTK